LLARWKSMTDEQRHAWAEAHPAPPREGSSRRRNRTPAPAD